MGSPISVIIAEITMQIFEKKLFALTNIVPDFWNRLVDDTITALPEENIESFHDLLNNIEPALQFTKEIEINNELPFLDMTIKRNSNDGTLSFKVYRKKTHTDRYLDFYSNNPLQHKKSVIKSLFDRAKKLCDDNSLEDEETHIKKF